MSEYTIGIDPGQSIDPTAFAAVRCLQDDAKPVFQCGYLERLPLNTTYPGIVQHARRLLQKQPFLGRAELVLDLTGVGRPVYDLFQKDLPDAPALRAELEDFRAAVTDSGRWTFGARAGAHDDLVLALALAVWRANKRRPRMVHPDVLRRAAQIRTRPSLDRGYDFGGGYDASGELRMLQQRALLRGR